MDLFIYLLPFAILLGIFSSYSDFKYSKIRNYILLFSLSGIIIVNIVFAFLIRDAWIMYKAYYMQYLLSVLFMFGLSMVLWLAGYWNAADSKLMTVFAMAITPGMIRYNFSNLYIMNFFYNVIFTSLIFVMFKSFRNIHTIKSRIKFFRKITLYEIFIMFVILYSFGFVSGFLFFIEDSIDRFYLTVILTIFLFYFLRRFRRWHLVLIIGVIVSTIINLKHLGTIQYWMNLLMIFVFVFVTRIVMEILSFANVDMVKMSGLKKGMFLAQELIIDSPSDRTGRSFFKEINYDVSIGLTEENIRLIHEKSHLLKTDEIFVSRKDPFAPYAFIGFILTLLMGTNIITFLRVIIG